MEENTEHQSEKNTQLPTQQQAEQNTPQIPSEPDGQNTQQTPNEPEEQSPQLPADQSISQDSEQPEEPSVQEEPDPEEIQKAKKHKQMNLMIGGVAVLVAVTLIVMISGIAGAVQTSSSGTQQTSGADAAASESNDTDSFNFQTAGLGDTAAAESAVTAGTFSSPDSQSDQQGSENSAQDNFSGAKISREEFNNLQIGMTYSEAAAAIGGNGKRTLSTGNMQIYEWAGYGSSDGAFARLTFKSGKLAKKYQFGL